MAYRFEKCIRNGNVAVMHTNWHGGGWYTWNKKHIGMLFDRDIVDLLEADMHDDIMPLVKKRYPGAGPTLLELNHLSITWLPVGTRFTVSEVNGVEYLITTDDLEHTA